jgi:hypothetical protein
MATRITSTTMGCRRDRPGTASRLAPPTAACLGWRLWTWASVRSPAFRGKDRANDPDLAIATLHVAVLPGMPRFDRGRGCPLPFQPAHQPRRDELAALVAARVCRGPLLPEQRGQGLDHAAADHVRHDADLFASNSANAALSSGSIAPGQVVAGNSAFRIPASETSFTLLWTPYILGDSIPVPIT